MAGWLLFGGICGAILPCCWLGRREKGRRLLRPLVWLWSAFYVLSWVPVFLLVAAWCVIYAVFNPSETADLLAGLWHPRRLSEKELARRTNRWSNEGMGSSREAIGWAGRADRDTVSNLGQANTGQRVRESQGQFDL